MSLTFVWLTGFLTTQQWLITLAMDDAPFQKATRLRSGRELYIWYVITIKMLVFLVHFQKTFSCNSAYTRKKDEFVDLSLLNNIFKPNLNWGFIHGINM